MADKQRYQKEGENMENKQYVTEKDIYEMFAEVYYKRIYIPLNNETIHVTEATQCLLKSFFQRKTPRALLEPKIVVLSMGDLIHKALAEPLSRRGYKMEVEGEYNIGNVKLVGHADALKRNHVIEIKTSSRIPHEALEHHYLQCNAYNHIFDMDTGYIVYIHKPSGTIRIFDVPRDTERWKYVCLRAYRLAHCLINGVTPNPEPSWLCSYCEYVDVCPAPLPSRRKRWL